MRIGFFIWEYPPQVVGGLGIAVRDLCEALAGRGHDISVFTLNDGTLKTREVINGIDVNRPMLVDGSSILLPLLTRKEREPEPYTGNRFFNDVFIYNILSATKFVNELVRKENYRFDLICAYDWLSAIAGMIVRRETGIPFVFYINSLCGYERPSGLRSEMILHIEEAAAKSADRVVTPCYATQEYLMMHGFECTRLDVCWGSIDLGRYSPDAVKESDIRALRARYHLEPDDEVVLFPGNLVSDRWTENLLKAMHRLRNTHPEAKLVILGRGYLEQRISQQIDDLGLADVVKTQFEVVSEEERILHFAASDIVACPSLYEPCSIITLEAMAMRKPVIVGSKGICSYCDHVVTSEHEQTGIHVDGNSSWDIACGIESMLNDPERAGEMGRQGRARVERLFSSSGDEVVERTMRIYQAVTNQSGTHQV